VKEISRVFSIRIFSDKGFYSKPSYHSQKMSQVPDHHEKYTKICPGGGLLLAWQLKGKKVLLVGGGNVAAGRLINVKDADGHLTVLCPSSGLCKEMKYRINVEKSVDNYIDKSYEGPEDIAGYDLILTAIDDAETSRTICQIARSLKIPVNVADVPPECDFYFGSLIRRGPLQVMVSTGGKGPRIAATTRSLIERALPISIGPAIEKVGILRAKLREKVPEPNKGAKRMRWMIDVCDAWSFDQLASLTPKEMDKILSGWEAGKVYKPRDVRGISFIQSLIPSRDSLYKSIFGTCPVVGYVSPWLAGIGGTALGVGSTLAVIAIRTKYSLSR
jgi:precorrin-2 dehydrogenase / sirohydrochlorin ferrochelatase